MSVFLDNCSTTKALPEVVDSVLGTMSNFYGNASSFHNLGILSENIIKNASNDMLRFLNARTGKIYFTSCGTESNNLAIFGSINIKEIKNILTSSIEHASVQKPIDKIKNMGANVSYISPNENFEISDEEISKHITPETNFISIMHVNNETGMIFPLDKISYFRKMRCPNAIFHVDAVQSFGKIPINVNDLQIDFLSMSAHKIHGPKGIASLYSSERVKLHPILLGGDQQFGIRAGTEPVELISGMHTAVKMCNIDSRLQKIKELNEYCREKLSKVSNIRINSPVNSSPYVINFSVLGFKSEVLVNFLSENGIYVSSASACSGNKKSKVLSSVGLDDNIIDSSIRISFSIYNTFEDIDVLINSIIDAQNFL